MTKKPSNPLKFFNDKADERVKKMQAGGNTGKSVIKRMFNEQDAQDKRAYEIMYKTDYSKDRTKQENKDVNESFKRQLDRENNPNWNSKIKSKK